MSPDEMNTKAGGPLYRCQACRAETGLHWYRESTTAVCAKPECTQALDEQVKSNA